MPQLDSYTYLGQVTFICAVLFVAYFCSKAFILPKVATSLKTPVKLQGVLSNQSSSLGDEMSFTKSV